MSGVLPAAVAQAASAASGGRGPRSNDARRYVETLLAVPPEMRRAELAERSPAEWAAILPAVHHVTGTAYGLWHDDPVGFTIDALGQSVWSLQRRVLENIRDVKRVAVPAGFGLGKTWLAAAAVCWWVCTVPVGVATAVTIATRMRQVQRQLWPIVRRIQARSHLPGFCDTVQWHMDSGDGVDTIVAYGFSPPDYDESAMQGIHAARLLLVVDEAGGIGSIIGNATRNLLTGGFARMLAIGNPPTDAERSWFESLSTDGQDPTRRDTTTVRIPATASPGITGEPVGACRDCPPVVPEHPLSEHLVDQAWIDGAVRDHTEEGAYVVAKVHAKFPRGTSRTAIPVDWVENAAETPDPDGDLVALCDLGLPDEPSEHLVRLGAWVRLGVDVAADGGDEMVIARCVGDLVTVEHASSGPRNANAVDVAGDVLAQILRAEALSAALGTTAPVRVKVDAIGVGWGVASTLTRWGEEGLHSAEIVAVVVSESPNREPDSVMLRPRTKRDEMWLAVRVHVQPQPGTGRSMIRLRVDGRTLAQLSGPRYKTMTAGGLTVIESKQEQRKRGLRSPDRAEALALSVYEPGEPKSRRKRAVLINR